MIDFQSDPLTITRTAEGFKVAIKGPIHTNTAWLDNELKRLAESKPKMVELDLSDVNYVSSSGLGTLTLFHRAVSGHQGIIRIVAIQAPVFGVLRHAFLDQLFEIKPDAIIKPTAK